MEVPIGEETPAGLPLIATWDSLGPAFGSDVFSHTFDLPVEPMSELPRDRNGRNGPNLKQRYSGSSKQNLATKSGHEAAAYSAPETQSLRPQNNFKEDYIHNTRRRILDDQEGQRGTPRTQAGLLKTRLLPRLIDIFETGGIRCGRGQGNEEVIPWVTLPKELLTIGCYVAGWPDICLPEQTTRFPDQISNSNHPYYWRLWQWRSMETQINNGAVKVLPRPEGRAVLFESVDEAGNTTDSTLGFSKEWVRTNLLALGPNPVHSTREGQKVKKKDRTKGSSLFGRVKKRFTRPWKRDKQQGSTSTPSELPYTSNMKKVVTEDRKGSRSGNGDMSNPKMPVNDDWRRGGSESESEEMLHAIVPDIQDWRSNESGSGSESESDANPIFPGIYNRRSGRSESGSGSGSGSGELHFSESRTSFGTTKSGRGRSRTSRASQSELPSLMTSPTNPVDPATSRSGSLSGGPRVPYHKRSSSRITDSPRSIISNHTPFNSSPPSIQQSGSKTAVRMATRSQDSQAFNRDLDGLRGVFPHVPRDTLAIYLSWAEGRTLMAIGRDLEDERQGTILGQ